MSTFYVDESGYTGEDLLNAEQPLFAQATNNFTDDEASAAIGEIFAGAPSTELKFNRLVRGGRNQNRVVDLIRFAAADPSRVGIWIANKEFAMVTFIVDWWVEPLAHRSGLNLYADGANIGMANMLYIALEGFWSREFRQRLLLEFQKMFRERTENAYNQCAAFVSKVYYESSGSRAEVLRYLWLSFPFLGHKHVVQVPLRVLDLALPGLVSIGHSWRDRIGAPLKVVYDQSTNMAKQRWLWDALSSPTLDAATFAYRGGSHSYPIGITETKFADSVQVKQLQICDVLAGAASSMVRNWNFDLSNRPFYKRLADAGLYKLSIDGIWPSTDVTPEALGTRGIDNNQAVEWVAEQLRGVIPPPR